MKKLMALCLTGFFCLAFTACKKRPGDAPADSEVRGFFQTEYIGEPFILHSKKLTKESIAEYVKRFRMADKDEDPTMRDLDLGEKVLLIADAFGIDPYIVTAIIRKESEFQKSLVGAGGASGLMQIMQPAIDEIFVQLGQKGPEHARKTTIDYLQKLMKDLYPKATGLQFPPKPWTSAMLPVMKTDPWQNIIYGSLILKVYLSVEKTKAKTGTMKDLYTKGLQFYNGSSKKVEYAKVVMSWADAMEKEYGDVTNISAKVDQEPGSVKDQSATTGITFTGNWSTVQDAKAEGGSYRHDQNSSKGAKTAVFKETSKNGIYKIYGRWMDHSGKGATNVPIEVAHAHGKSFFKVNQKEKPGEWNYLGTFTLDPANATVTVLNAGTNGFVVADAFKFIETDLDPLIIIDSYDRDEKRLSVTGNWDSKDDTAEVELAYNKSIHLADPANGVATMTFKPNAKGKYLVSALWLDGADHASNAKYIVHTGGVNKEILVNQKIEGGRWRELGIFELDPASYVTLTTEGADGVVIADAIRFDAAP